MNYLKHFAIKFHRAMRKLSRLVDGKRGAQTAFIYSNLVKVGIEVFQEILIRNGYLEYQENASQYKITGETTCYFCGKRKSEHRDGKMEHVGDGDESEGEEYASNNISSHQFGPATFISITGKSGDERSDTITEDKKKILDLVFNSPQNKTGRKIKFVLGSKVMNEGISLQNVSEVHILDAYFNLGRDDQVVGRVIRWCSHYHAMSEKNPFPTVKVYRYAVALEEDSEKGLSSEEKLYGKAERKYILVKKIERILKMAAVDCPLNARGNMFSEEMDEYDNCENDPNKDCPAICDYMACNYKCINPELNKRYYNSNTKMYDSIDKKNIDQSTFTHKLADAEVILAKRKIKEMYVLGSAYTMKEIIAYVENAHRQKNRPMFDHFSIFKAVDDFVPVTENDFNNYMDTIVDGKNTSGYLIHRGEYYIFQPFELDEDVSMYYRINDTDEIRREISLGSYVKHLYKKDGNNKEEKAAVDIPQKNTYNFNKTFEYYDSRNEYKYVGTVDDDPNSRDNEEDVFKIRGKHSKNLTKKRGTGIPSTKGAVCKTSKKKSYLVEIANDLGIGKADKKKRDELCDDIKNALLEKEKYATEKAGDKMTYIQIPANHPTLPFPYNLEDRVKAIILNVKNSTSLAPKTEKKGRGYNLVLKDNTKHKKYLTANGWKKTGDKWVLAVD